MHCVLEMSSRSYIRMSEGASGAEEELEKIWLDVRHRESSDALRRGFFSQAEAPRHFLSQADVDGAPQFEWSRHSFDVETICFTLQPTTSGTTFRSCATSWTRATRAVDVTPSTTTIITTPITSTEIRRSVCLSLYNIL